MNDDDSTPPFIPPAPVKPGFDRVENFTTPAERWGYTGRPSKMKVPLPEGWRPSRPLTPEEEERLVDMTLWAKAHGVLMADWNAFFEGSWLRKYNRTQKPLPGSKGAMSNALDKLDQFIARTDGPRGSSKIGSSAARGLPKPDST